MKPVGPFGMQFVRVIGTKLVWLSGMKVVLDMRGKYKKLGRREGSGDASNRLVFVNLILVHSHSLHLPCQQAFFLYLFLNATELQ
jgi:hypothetical protein